MTDKEIAFKQLLERHQDMIWQICQNFRFSAAWEVDDAFQEVLIVLWRDFERFEGRSSERTWVYKVATTTLLMIKRKISNKPQPEATAVTDVAAPDWENFKLLEQLVENLGGLDAQIVQAYLDGFDYKEVAEMVNMTPGAVAMRISRAKKKLRKQYTDLL
ncbi:MAG: sigma-70 family RNA polymerase sigma factor [Bacteroidales bacterium]|nr:sigma-70 family RNA polymerase sigma factor [Bacteroidales bacterium]